MRAQASTAFEEELWQAGSNLLAGLDEAGRGCWAGPVAAGAVVFSPEIDLTHKLSGVRDSKQMTPRQRTFWAERIKQVALAWAVGYADHHEIDELGIVPATRLAMRRALYGLGLAPQHLLIDAVHLPEVDLPQTVLIKGDVRCLSIAAASVLAKTGRDALMVEMDKEYAGYGFERHKGYGTRQHMDALQRLGVCGIHRRSFAPVRDFADQHRLQ